MYILYSLLAFITSFVLIFLLLKLPERFSVFDNPNHRSLHSIPVPRIGGIAILVGILIAGFIYSRTIVITNELLLVCTALLMIGLISLLDDVVSLSSLIRIVIQLLAASIIAYSGLVIDTLTIPFFEFSFPVYFAEIITVLFIVWMVNLYNFMDGVDGLAGGMSVIGFGALAVIGFIEGQQSFTIINLIIASSSLGFLVWNYPPAKIFMGDSGSSSLGLLAAILALYSHSEGFIPIWISVVIFSPFIVDATVTLISRILRRKRFWDAHKSHFYQQLAETGISRKKLVNLEYGLMLVCSVIALITYKASSTIQLLSLLILATLYFVLMRYIVKKTV